VSAAAQPIEPRPPISLVSAGRIFLIENEAPPSHLYEERHCPECGMLNPHHDKACWLKLVE
jgi:hypothetical protein